MKCDRVTFRCSPEDLLNMDEARKEGRVEKRRRNGGREIKFTPL